MKATIILLPPFLHSCQNVPCAVNTTTTTPTTITPVTKRTTPTKRTRTPTSANTTDSSSGSRNIGSSSCCQWAHNKTHNGKHATTPRLSTGDDVAVRNNNNNIKKCSDHSNSHHCYSSQSQSHSWSRSESAGQNQISTSRSGRERHKALHLLQLSASAAVDGAAKSAHYCSVTTAQQSVNNITASTTAPATTTTTMERMKSTFETLHRGDCTHAAKVRVATLKTHSCLADSLRFRNRRQLVMPIVENSLGNASTARAHENSNSLEEAEAEAETRVPVQQWPQLNAFGASKSTMTPMPTPTVVATCYGYTTSNNNTRKNSNVSQTTTTTLEYRCFKDNGDICLATDDELCKLDNALEATTKPCTKRDLQSGKDDSTGRGIHQRLFNPTMLPQALRKRMYIDETHARWWSKLWFLALLMLMLTSSANCWSARQDVLSNCTFPARWEGSWFLSGYQQSIHIKGSQFSYRGRCAASDGNKYLIVDEKGCHRCLVIYEKHKNVLQYKESECEGDSMYTHQTNPSAMAMRSGLKQNDHRGGAHPNLNNNNGHSRLSSSDQYIMRSNDDSNDYFCKGRETLQNLCDQIPGDALLYSLFRENAEPVKCPLKGPFVFTYNRGHGECKYPVSNIESCTEDSRLLLSFQACPDVQGTESTVEELTCLATWKDGNSRYLVGLVSHHHAISNEERYRCFVYEKISSLMGGPSVPSAKDAEYKLAQSGDATCNGLDSAEVGSRIMSLRKPPLTERCDFPAWFKGPRHWHALMGNAVYNYHSNDGSVHIIKPNGFMETRALCEQINKQTSTELTAVVHYTTGCQSGFMCMAFYRRDTHVIEIQTGKQASRLEDACAPDHFDVARMPYITLLASNPDPQICPMEGLYNLRGAIGPPYLTTRHKRNHNNKAHLGHGHHHGQSEFGGNSGGYGHKRHATLSFRNSDRVDRGSWHANTRGLPIRSRRAAAATSSTTSIQKLNVLDEAGDANTTATVATTITSVGFVAAQNDETVSDVQKPRSRRDAPSCVTNYKAQRRLWVGCTEADVIDVRPKCPDDDDEEYFCHGSWTENRTVYVIARHKGTKHGVCISYRPTEGNAAKLVIGDACYRGTQKPPEHHLVANLTVFGKCGETGSAGAILRAGDWSFLLTVALLITLLGERLSAWQQTQVRHSSMVLDTR